MWADVFNAPVQGDYVRLQLKCLQVTNISVQHYKNIEKKLILEIKGIFKQCLQYKPFQNTQQWLVSYLIFYSQLLFHVRPGLTFKNSTWCRTAFMCSVWTFPRKILTGRFCITQVESVYYAVRTGSLYKAERFRP